VPPAVRITGFDATTQGAFGSDTYDRVLLDAPCSSDRHLLRNPEELAKWGPGRIKVNAARQTALLACALDAARPGGTVVYATCALSNRENDDVVTRVLARLPFPAAVVPLAFAFGEATPLGGWHVLPDTGLGFGPLYICKLIKGTATVPRATRGDYSKVVPAACPAEAAAAAAAILAGRASTCVHTCVSST
jgi:16S rRNA C967 or C1407 C5-methylase (RsmB/RsmF family)